MPTVLGCPWETHERQPCELLEYTGAPRCTGLPLLAGGRGNRETVSVLVYYMGPGEHSIFGRHPQKRGNRRTRIIPLVDTYGIIFPKTAQDCKPFFMKVSELGCGYAAGVDLWITLQGQGYPQAPHPLGQHCVLPT